MALRPSAARRAGTWPLRASGSGGEKTSVADPSPETSALPQPPPRTYRPLLGPAVEIGVIVAVIACHVGIGLALAMASSTRLEIGDIAPMEVRLVPGEPASTPEVESAEPPPPVDLKPPDLATIVDPPPPDLPPPEFPLAKLEVPPPQEPPPPVIPKPAPKAEPKPAPKPQPRAEPRPQREQPGSPNTGPTPVEGNPQGAPQAAVGPRTVSASQLGYLVPPNPVYPARSRKSGEQGSVTVRVLVDAAGRPSQIMLQASSGHPALDEAAISAVRAAQFRPYSDGGAPQPVWVLVPINFVLR